MSLDPHIKQQIRYQVETSMQELYNWQHDILKIAAEAINRLIIRQYQTYHRYESKHRYRRSKRQSVLQSWQQVLDQRFQQVIQATPFAKPLTSLSPLLHLPLRSAELIEKQIDEQVFRRIYKLLKLNSALIDRLSELAFAKLEQQQATWKDKMREQLAMRLPLSDEEHLALARDITDIVKRIGAPEFLE